MWNESSTTATSKLDREYQSFLRQYDGTGGANAQRGGEKFNRRKRDFSASPDDPLMINTGEIRSGRPSLAPKLDFESGEETDFLFNIPPPAKKIVRTMHWSQNTVKTEQKTDSCRMELIDAKAEVSKMQSKLIRYERENALTRVELERMQNQHNQEKQYIERKIEAQERELISLRDEEAKRKKEADEKSLNESVDKQKLHFELNSSRQDRRNSLESYAELESASRREIDELRLKLNAEKIRTLEIEERLSSQESEITNLRERNAQLITENCKVEEEKLDLQKKARDACLALSQYEEDNKKAMAMRDEMLAVSELKTKVGTLTVECQRYKERCENTILLREKVFGLEQQLQRLKMSNIKTVAENNELKLLISKSSSSEEGVSRLHSIDTLTAELASAKESNQKLAAEIRQVTLDLETAKSLEEEREYQMKEKMEEYQERFDQQQDSIEHLRSKCEEHEEVMDQVQNELAETKSRLLNAENQLLEEEAEMNQYRVQMESLQEQLRERTSPNAEETPSTSQEKLPEDVERLKQELAEKNDLIDGLQERLHMKGDFDPVMTKVLHMEHNPLDEAHKDYHNELENLKKSYSMVKARLEEVEKERDKWEREGKGEELDLTTRVEIRQKEQKAEEQIEALKSDIKKLEKEKERVKDTSALVGRQYREMCTLLTGYQCKMRDQSIYEVQSIYEEGQEKSFLFKKSADNLHLMVSEYTPQWSGFVDTYLETDDCIPAFLAAVTLQLYARKQEEMASAQQAEIERNMDSTTA